MFPRRQKKYNLPWSSSLHPPALNALLPSWASVKVFTLYSSYVLVPQLSSMWKDGSQNHTVTFGKGSNMQKMLENQRMCRSWRIFLKNSRQLSFSGPTRVSRTTITAQKQSWIIQKRRHGIKIQACVNFWTNSLKIKINLKYFYIIIKILNIINILHILQGPCKFMSTTVCVRVCGYIYIYIQWVRKVFRPP